MRKAIRSRKSENPEKEGKTERRAEFILKLRAGVVL